MVNRSEERIASLFESLSREFPLLPPKLEEKRLRSLVYDSLRINGRADVKKFLAFSPNGHLQANEHLTFLESSAPFKLAEITTQAEESLFLMDKLTPHSQYELMVMSAGKVTKSALSEHDRKTRAVFFTIANNFPQYAKTHDLYPYIAFSYDPETFDRESGQCEKRFHAHFIGRSIEEMAVVRSGARQLSELSPLRRRRLIDESTVVGSILAYDFIRHGAPLYKLKMVRPFADDESPFLSFTLAQGWDTLLTDAFDADFIAIHSALVQVHESLMAACTDGQSGMWQRPSIQESTDDHQSQFLRSRLSNLKWIEPESLETLLNFLQNLKPSLLSRNSHLLRDSNFRDVAIHVYPLAGLCYSTAFFEIGGSVQMIIRPQLFSDLGGAGVELLQGVTTKLKRSSGVFSENEMLARKQFQLEFSQLIRKQFP